MKRSARVASILIFIFFIFFNALQVYLIIERCTETKNRFNFACSDALLAAQNEYIKLKSVDSASMPRNGWVAYSQDKIAMSRMDTQNVKLGGASSSIITDTVDLAYIDAIVNRQYFKEIDFVAFDTLYKKALIATKINAEYRLDTISFSGRKPGRGTLQAVWTQKRRQEYPYATRPVRLPPYSSFAVFAELKYDQYFFRNDLFRSMVAFALILLIGNAALVFVYRTIMRQKRINELKTDFINNITHEMKTPITIASAGVEALEHHITPTDRTSFYLQTSKRQLHLLNDFVERIVEAAVGDIADFTLKKEKIDVHSLFVDIIKSHAVLNGKPVNFRLSGAGPVFIYGDKLHLETAFRNIIDNAIKYSNGSVDIHIDIVDDSRDCTINISDNGMGIPPQYIKSIFDKFFRVPQGDAQRIKGFGLGLYYVRSIVKKHSGNITVQSKWQSGTEFIITLPKHT